MGKMIAEQEVSLSLISEFLEEAAWNIKHIDNRLMLHSLRGFEFSICQDEARKFLIFNTYFEIKGRFEEAISLANKLNEDVFMTRFSIDKDGDLSISYSMSYERGLILGQLSRVTLRFSDLLGHVVDKFDTNGEVFELGKESQPKASGPTTLQ